MILTNVLFPLLAGVFLAIAILALRPGKTLQAICLLLLFLGLYWLLEGIPQFPPVAAKQKLGFGLAALGAASLLGHRFRLSQWVVFFGSLLAFAVWLGWGKLQDPSQWVSLLVAFLPVLAVFVAGKTEAGKTDQAWLWPVSILMFCIGTAVVTLLGGFIGMGQLLGASAAAIGGMLLVSFILQLARKGSDVVPSGSPELSVVIGAICAIAFMAGAFAPSLNRAAFAVVSLTLLIPVVFPKNRNLPLPVAPFAVGAMAILPVLAAVAMAWTGFAATLL